MYILERFSEIQMNSVPSSRTKISSVSERVRGDSPCERAAARRDQTPVCSLYSFVEKASRLQKENINLLKPTGFFHTDPTEKT